MSTLTSSGTTPHGALVNAEGQLFTLAETQSEARHVSSEGGAFLISTGFLTHSDVAGTYTAMFWIKNTSTTVHIHVGYLRTSNDVIGKWIMYSGPTALDNTPTTLTATNKKIGDTGTLEATLEASDTAGSAFTNGTIMDGWIQDPGEDIQSYDGALLLPPQQSIGLSFAPNGAASSNKASVTLQVWKVTP